MGENIKYTNAPFLRCVNKLYFVFNLIHHYSYLLELGGKHFWLNYCFIVKAPSGKNKEPSVNVFNIFSLVISMLEYRTCSLYVPWSLYVCPFSFFFFPFVNFSLAEPHYVFWRWNWKMHLRIGLQIHPSTNIVLYELQTMPLQMEMLDCVVILLNVLDPKLCHNIH